MASQVNELENAYAIDCFFRNKFVKDDDPRYIDFQFFTRKLDTKLKHNTSLIYKDRLLTRIWTDLTSKDHPQVKVLMERGNISYEHLFRTLFESIDFTKSI
jgi:hypothetical protein